MIETPGQDGFGETHAVPIVEATGVSKRYGGYRKLGSVRLARSVHASVKYRAVFMNLFFYKKTIDGANTRTNHIHFAVELNEVAVAALAAFAY